MSGAAFRRRAPVAGRGVTRDARIIPLCRAPEPPLPELGHVAARRPLVVAADDACGAAALAELTGAGWLVVDTAASAEGRGCTRYTVRGRVDAQAVVVAALRGDPVFAQLRPGSGAEPNLADIADDLVEDLAGLGPVVVVDDDSVVNLDEDSWRLAHEIARGATLEAVARSLHLSTRTANRRLTAARQALGVGSRAELVRALTSAGRVPPAPAAR